MDKKRRLDFTTGSQTLGNIYMDYLDKALNLRPKYQREFVWSDNFKYKLIYSIVRNYPIGNITIRKLVNPKPDEYKSEVVDGQQRLTTIFNFLEGSLTISGEDSNEIMREVIDEYSEEEMANRSIVGIMKKFEKNKTFSLSYSELPQRVQVRMNNYNLSISNMNQVTDKEVAEYFRFVQNQERLRAGEILNAFVDSPIDDVLYENCDVSKMMKVLNFDNSRKDFNKLFSAILGLSQGALNLGCKDSDIITYVRNETKNGQVSDSLLHKAKKLSLELSYIGKLEDVSIKTNKRYIKLLLISILIENLSLKENTVNTLRAFENFNNNLSAFNSAKKNEVKRIFEGKYTDDSQENHRLVALITKGGHNLARVSERSSIMMKILKDDYEL